MWISRLRPSILTEHRQCHAPRFSFDLGRVNCGMTLHTYFPGAAVFLCHLNISNIGQGTHLFIYASLVSGQGQAQAQGAVCWVLGISGSILHCLFSCTKRIPGPNTVSIHPESDSAFWGQP